MHKDLTLDGSKAEFIGKKKKQNENGKEKKKGRFEYILSLVQVFWQLCLAERLDLRSLGQIIFDCTEKKKKGVIKVKMCLSHASPIPVCSSSVETTDTENGICFYRCMWTGETKSTQQACALSHYPNHFHQPRHQHSTAQRSKSQTLLPQAYGHSGVFLLLMLQETLLLSPHL